MSSYFEANEAADAVHTLNITDVEIPEGYELVADGQYSLVLYRDVESTGYVTVRKKAVEEVKKTVKVVFTVDPTKGEFPGYDGSTSIHYTIDEDSEEQYLLPEVKAADGYKFVGWQVEGKESGTEGETKYLTVKYLDEAGNNIEGVADTTMSSISRANEAADAVHTLNITDVEILKVMNYSRWTTLQRCRK